MTAKELAGKMGVSEASLSQSIKEGANPNLKTLVKIAEALDIPMAELFDEPAMGSIRCPHCGKPVTLVAKG